MGSSRRKNEARDPAKRGGTAQRAPARQPWLLLLLALAVVVAAVVIVVKLRESSGRQASPATQSTAARATDEGTVPVIAPAPAVLVGKWQRTDGDYALDIRRVGADGRAEATYSNPGPINVGRAEVKQDGSRLILLVELRDVNYPGSTYTLAYQPGEDALAGSYYQPASGNTYEVAFLRAK